MTWVLDLDGVLWLGEQPIAGSADAIAELRARGERVAFVTNNSALTVEHYADKLARFGVALGGDELCTSAQAAARLVDPGARAVVCAGAGVAEALSARNVEIVPAAPADVVVVGWHVDFDYARLTVAMRAVCSGARLVGTNDDATYPTPDGPVPGGGAILAAVSYASGVAAEVAGKPNAAMAALVTERLGAVDVVVGDRPSTDGVFAQVLGARFALVLSGVTSAADLPVEPAPAITTQDLAALVAGWRE